MCPKKCIDGTMNVFPSLLEKNIEINALKIQTVTLMLTKKETTKL